MNGKRFTVDVNADGRAFVFDDDFHYDAALRITGDFGTRHEKMAYAAAVADALNGADIPNGRKT